MSHRYDLALAIIILIGSLIGFYWTIGRHWITARRTGQRLIWPLVTWLYDSMQADLRALENRVDQAQQRVDQNNCGNSAVGKTDNQSTSAHPPLARPQLYPLTDHRPVQRLPKRARPPYDPSIN